MRIGYLSADGSNAAFRVFVGLASEIPSAGLQVGDLIITTDADQIRVATGPTTHSQRAQEILADTLANRPAAGVVGRFFWATDSKDFYRDSGSVWELVNIATSNAAASGTVVSGMATGLSSTPGSDATFSRGNHAHGTPGVVSLGKWEDF